MSVLPLCTRGSEGCSAKCANSCAENYTLLADALRSNSRVGRKCGQADLISKQLLIEHAYKYVRTHAPLPLAHTRIYIRSHSHGDIYAHIPLTWMYMRWFNTNMKIYWKYDCQNSAIPPFILPKRLFCCRCKGKKRPCVQFLAHIKGEVWKEYLNVRKKKFQKLR